MVERLLGFMVLQTEHDMYGQCGSSGSTQRGQQADGKDGKCFAFDVVPDFQRPAWAERKTPCSTIGKIRYALYMVQTNRTEDEQGEQQGQTEHVAGAADRGKRESSEPPTQQASSTPSCFMCFKGFCASFSFA